MLGLEEVRYRKVENNVEDSHNEKIGKIICTEENNKLIITNDTYRYALERVGGIFTFTVLFGFILLGHLISYYESGFYKQWS